MRRSSSKKYSGHMAKERRNNRKNQKVVNKQNETLLIEHKQGSVTHMTHHLGESYASNLQTEKTRRLTSIGKTIKDLNDLNTYLMTYGACLYMVEDYENGARYRWKFHNYLTNMYMWVTDKMLSDIMDRKVYHTIIMRKIEKYFLEHPKCEKYRHD